MSRITDPVIEEYAEAHSSAESALLREVAETTRELLGTRAGMMVGSLEGGLLATLVAIAQPRLVVEIGTFTGYSALSMASALPSDGRIVTCEVDPEHAGLARDHFARSTVGGRIDLRVGPAIETLGTIDEQVDMAFVDADKAGYPDYYAALLPKLSPTGFMVFDNVLWSGRVVEDPSPDDDADTIALRGLNEAITNDGRVEVVMLPIRDGVSIVRRRG